MVRDFRIKLTSSEVTCLPEAKVLLELKWLFTDILFLILIMLKWFLFFLIMLCKTILLSKPSLWQTTFSGFKPLDYSTMLIWCALKSFAKHLSSVIILLFPLSIYDYYLSNPCWWEKVSLSSKILCLSIYLYL